MSPSDARDQPQNDVASLYSRVAARYAEDGPPFFAHAGQRLVELAGVQSGDVVLDLGTGRGAVLLPAAERVAQTAKRSASTSHQAWWSKLQRR